MAHGPGDSADARHMALALSLGRRGLGKTWPNPSVGCVIIKGGRIIGRGRTGDGGAPHGEVAALAQAGAAARGATAYVTLEPCSHHGRTPPCADALIAAGVARVVAATGDPNPAVNGGGFARLRAAGIEVTTGICAAEARRDHAGFLLSQTAKRPFVTLKLAMTLDGRIATGSGESKWITGPGARRQVHAMRARHDAVMVGGGTARADDPELTVRGMGAQRQPVRVVLSRWLNLPTDSRMLRGAGEAPVWIVHDSEASDADTAAHRAAGAVCLPAAGSGGGLDMDAALAALAARGLTRVFCEGGGALAASLLAAGLVDELCVFHAGLGIGAEGTPGLGVLGLERLADAQRFRLADLRPVEGDVMSLWRPA